MEKTLSCCRQLLTQQAIMMVFAVTFCGPPPLVLASSASSALSTSGSLGESILPASLKEDNTSSSSSIDSNGRNILLELLIDLWIVLNIHRPTLNAAHNAEVISAIPSPKTLERFFEGSRALFFLQHTDITNFTTTIHRVTGVR
jgi:hypothetical protein